MKYLIPFLLFCSCQLQSQKNTFDKVETTLIELPSSASFRGIHGNKNQIWLAGSNSEVWKYDVKSNVLTDVSPFTIPNIQFRDVEVLGDDTAIIMTAGFPAMLLKTKNGGSSWDTVFHDVDSLAFFDGIDFEQKEGYLFGDPLEGKFQVFKTNDFGDTWAKDTSVYTMDINDIEAGFAASGSSILVQNQKVTIGLGGDKARIFVKQHESWTAKNTPLAQGGSSKGIYSLDFYQNHGIAVGGQYDNPTDDSTRAYTMDNGMTWQLGTGVNEYRSSVVMLNKLQAVACGPSGIDLSTDGGKTWYKVSNISLHALYWPKHSSVGYGSGAKGTFYQIQML